MLPRIAIPVPTSRDLEYNRKSWSNYATAVQRSGGEPVCVELGTPSSFRVLAQGVQGFLLPGSPADVEPGRYGVEADPFTAAADPAREDCDYALLDMAERSGKPVLGICFGLQSMNVWRGGSLVQHLAPLPCNHAAGPEVAIAHTIVVTGDSALAGLLDSQESRPEGSFVRLPVNTSHHQAVATPGTGLRVVARCPDDGVIEALEGDTRSAQPNPAFLLGVQWHPERSFDLSATSRALFARLVTAATVWAETTASFALR